MDLNPFGTVPLLVLDNEDTLREVPVILRFVAGFGRAPPLLPAPGTVNALRAEEWLGFLSSELHAGLDAFAIGRSHSAIRLNSVSDTMPDGR